MLHHDRIMWQGRLDRNLNQLLERKLGELFWLLKIIVCFVFKKVTSFMEFFSSTGTPPCILPFVYLDALFKTSYPALGFFLCQFLDTCKNQSGNL